MSHLDDLRKQREQVIDFIQSRPAEVYNNNLDTYRATLDAIDAEIDALIDPRTPAEREQDELAAEWKKTQDAVIRDGVSNVAWWNEIEEVEF
jgi:uncharacterized protein YhaN